MAETKLPLRMISFPKVNIKNRYLITDSNGSYDSNQLQVLHFPQEAEIKDLWSAICPGVNFWPVKGGNHPVKGFWVDIGPGTSYEQRKQFCAALLEQCIIETA